MTFLNYLQVKIPHLSNRYAVKPETFPIGVYFVLLGKNEDAIARIQTLDDSLKNYGYR